MYHHGSITIDRKDSELSWTEIQIQHRRYLGQKKMYSDCKLTKTVVECLMGVSAGT